jgi:hypothetical protein
MTAPLKILIVGGYGVFGGRIVELLETNPNLTLVVAGRSLDKAEAFCRSRFKAAALLIAARFDRDGDVGAQIARHKSEIVIDASGPFQAYGENRYRVVEACIARKVNYLDLADGSDFVAGVKALDVPAKAAGVWTLSGVSSFPVLTSAVVRRLAAGMSRVDGIRGGVAPSPHARVGENVIRAIAGYCGQPVALKRGGRTAVGHPMTEQIRYAISPPGRLPLRSTLFSLVDVPDLRVLSDLWPEARDVWMGAGPGPEILHLFLIGLSWLVRWRLVPSLTPFAGLMHWATNRLRWGEHRGGMFVEVAGLNAEGEPAKRSWHLLVDGDDGPLIPSMAAQAIVRRVLEGRPPAAGARAATGDLELQDFETLFADRAIFTGVRDETAIAGENLYRRILGSAYDALPFEIREMHHATEARGEASVERGAGFLAKLAAWFVGFPGATPRTPVRVIFDRADGRETWTRSFGAETFRSVQFAGSGRSDRLLVERFGPLAFGMALVVEGPKLSLKLCRWTAFGVGLPMWLCPRSTAFESVEDGRFHFDVEISHPLTGPIVRYHGWLKPEGVDGDGAARAEILERSGIRATAE